MKKNIILLGYKGVLGRKVFEDNINTHNIFTDKKINISDLISKKFILKNRIDYIVNCIGEKTKKEFFFTSNYLLTGFISKRLSELDPFLKEKLLYIHISSIGVNNPFEKYNLENIKFDVNRKQRLNYSLYEFSKSAADYILINNMDSLKNINFTIIKPSNIIEKNSKFLYKLKLFLLLLPFRLPKKRSIPITKLSNLSKYINNLLNSEIKNSNYSKNLYSRYKLSDLTKDFKLIMMIKPELPNNFTKKIITTIPDIVIFRSLKRLLILLYFL
ncbi:hypothetical protein B0W81_00930 [Prochlorococcus sp. HOT_208_60]|nr:hypothetical protein B0W81_00930 [Prochlorococcus sp. HOT_208_60]